MKSNLKTLKPAAEVGKSNIGHQLCIITRDCYDCFSFIFLFFLASTKLLLLP